MKTYIKSRPLTVGGIDYDVYLQPEAGGFTFDVRQAYLLVTTGWTAGTRREAYEEAENCLRLVLARRAV